MMVVTVGIAAQRRCCERFSRAVRSVMRMRRRSVEIQPDYAKGHYFLGLLLVARGDRTGAAAELEAALQHDPALAPAAEALEKLR